MDCRDCESILIEYASGELPEERVGECREHLAGCPSCRETLAEYRCLLSMVADEPEAEPTAEESARLARALEQARLPRACEVPSPSLNGLPGFAAACVFAFALITALLALAAFGVIDVWAVASAIGPGMIVAIVVVVIFVASFVPIAATAKRRPLNGMTFRR